MGEEGPISIEGKDIYINEDGTVQVDGASVGKLSIVSFRYPEKLYKEGSSLFAYKGAPLDEQAPPDVSVKQGSLERPNVTTVVEMTKMIETMRFYESFQKVIQSFDETNAKAINEVGKLQ